MLALLPTMSNLPPSVIKLFFSNSAETENELKPLKPGAIKVETRFRYHFGLLRPKK
jgi:hypothetical protein